MNQAGGLYITSTSG